jgi:hypothetical protein
MSRRAISTLAGVLLIAACGGGTAETATTADTGSATSQAEPETVTTVDAASTTVAPQTGSGDDPCALVSAETVAEAFGGTSAEGVPGPARNCSFTVEGGIAPTVEVFHFGSAADWDGVKAGYEENRGGVTAVSGVGEDAYQPNDVGPYELVVRTDDVIFAVAVQSGGGGPEVEGAIVALANEIAGG